MRSLSAPPIVLLGFAAGVLANLGCGGTTRGDGQDTLPMGASGGRGDAGPVAPSGGAGGLVGTGAGPSGGKTTGGTGEGGEPSGGAEPVGGAAGLGGSGSSGASGSGGASGPDIREVWKSDGCGKAYEGPTGAAPITLGTFGEKEPNCAAKLNGQPRCGLWGQAGSTWQTEPIPRDHYIYLPEAYDPSVVYNLVLLAPGCGGNGTAIYPYNNNVDGTAIRVGISPPPLYVGHGTNENQGCFDDKEGDDSVDWVQYEMMYDQLNEELCFDRNRVFAGGNSSGAWWANELGCKYAGDVTRPVRGIIPNTGGLPTEPAYVPTCSKAPMAGMWIREVGDTTSQFDGSIAAISRAMSVNSCPIGTTEANATFEDFPIGGGQVSTTCGRILGCDPLHPLVVCRLPGNGHGSHDEVVNPGASTFIKLFSQPGFVVP